MGKSVVPTTREQQHGMAGERWASSYTVRADGTRHTGRGTLRRAGVSWARSLLTLKRSGMGSSNRPRSAGHRPGSARVARRRRGLSAAGGGSEGQDKQAGHDEPAGDSRLMWAVTAKVKRARNHMRVHDFQR